MTSEDFGIWYSGFGKFIRWLIFIPIGISIASILEILTILGCIWLFEGDLREFIIIGILFGSLFSIIPIIVMIYYHALKFINFMICPVPEVGTIIFGTFYMLSQVYGVSKIFMLKYGFGYFSTYINS